VLDSQHHEIPGLELIDELINHVPHPAGGELHVDIRMEEEAKESLVVLPGLDALAKIGLAAGIEVAVVHFRVEEAEDVVVVHCIRNVLD
jgi:hypothetical protein